jgi:hypothetical protein
MSLRSLKIVQMVFAWCACHCSNRQGREKVSFHWSPIDPDKEGKWSPFIGDPLIQTIYQWTDALALLVPSPYDCLYLTVPVLFQVTSLLVCFCVQKCNIKPNLPLSMLTQRTFCHICKYCKPWKVHSDYFNLWLLVLRHVRVIKFGWFDRVQCLLPLKWPFQCMF